MLGLTREPAAEGAPSAPLPSAGSCGAAGSSGIVGVGDSAVGADQARSDSNSAYRQRHRREHQRDRRGGRTCERSGCQHVGPVRQMWRSSARRREQGWYARAQVQRVLERRLLAFIDRL